MFLFHSNNLLDKPNEPMQEENKKLEAKVTETSNVKLFFFIKIKISSLTGDEDNILF